MDFISVCLAVMIVVIWYDLSVCRVPLRREGVVIVLVVPFFGSVRK